MLNRNQPPTGAQTLRRLESEFVQCRCSSSYFEQVQVHRYPKLHNVIPGQRVPQDGRVTFYLLRCVRCNELYEPNMQIGPRDANAQAYNEFLDLMEKPVTSGIRGPSGERL